MGNTLAKAFCTLALLSCAVTSAYLTYLYMHELGSAIGIAVIFALIGITFDLVKTVAPTFIPMVAKQNAFTALLLTGLTVVLMLISTIASVSALEKGANQMAVTTKQNVAITEQINNKKLELENLQLLSKTQISVNQISNASTTAVSVSRVTDELNDLYLAQSNAKDTSLLSRYDSSITLFIAISIEVVSVVMALALHSLNTLESSVSDKIQSVLPSVNSNKTLEIHFAASVLEEVAGAVLGGAVKPSYRGLKAAFGMHQEQSKQVLSALHKRGVLESWNNGGYRLRPV